MAVFLDLLENLADVERHLDPEDAKRRDAWRAAVENIMLFIQ